MSSWIPMQFQKILCQDSDYLMETFQLLFANISNQQPGRRGEMDLKLHKVSSSGFVQHRNHQLPGFGLFEFCLCGQTRALLAPHGISVRVTKFLAEMAGMVKWAKSGERQSFAAPTGRALCCPDPVLLGFIACFFVLCLMDTGSLSGSCQSSEGSLGGSERKTAPGVWIGVVIAGSVSAQLQECARVPAVCRSGGWVQPHGWLWLTPAREQEGQTDRPGLLLAWLGRVPEQDGSWAHHQPAALQDLSRKICWCTETWSGGTTVPFQVGVANWELQLLNFSALPFDHRGIAGWKSKSSGMFFTVHR